MVVLVVLVVAVVLDGSIPGNHILAHLDTAWPPLEDFMKGIHVTKQGYHGGTYEGRATVLDHITSSNCDFCDDISTGFNINRPPESSYNKTEIWPIDAIGTDPKSRSYILILNPNPISRS